MTEYDQKYYLIVKTRSKNKRFDLIYKNVYNHWLDKLNHDPNFKFGWVDYLYDTLKTMNLV